MSPRKPAQTLDAVVRVSRVNGREGESFMSPDEQREVIRSWASRSGVTISQWHDELDVSGKTTDREGLRAAADRAARGDVDGIVVARVNRFARNLLSGLTTLHELNAAGRRLVFVEENIDTGTKMNAAAKLMLNMLLSVAQWQLDSLTEQWETINDRVIRRGVARQEPFGYRRGDDKRLVPVEAEAEALREVFRARADGKSWAELADILNKAGHKPRRAERFTFARMTTIIQNDVYLGILRSGALVNPTAHEPIIDRALWEAANGQRRTAAKRTNQPPLLLAGIIRCPGCGVRMNGMRDTRTLADGSVVEYRRYRCRVSHSFGVCPAPIQVKAGPVEDAVEDRFRELYLSRRDLAAEPLVGDELAEAVKALGEAEAELSSFVMVARAVDQSVFAAGLAARQEAVDAARQSYAVVERARTGLSLPPDLGDLWDDLSTEERRGFLSDGIAAVTVIDGVPVIWAVNDPGLPALPGYGIAQIVPLVAPGRAWIASSRSS